jgi:acyl-homoserine lactone synthase
MHVENFDMLKIIYEADDPELMEKVWSFRHKRFVEELGWEELRRDDCRERDEFDTADTLHAVLVHGGNVIGYSRLLPTTRSHLTNDFCRQHGIEPPSGPHIYEWSRCAAELGAPDVNGHAASDLLMTGVLECLVEIGARAVVFLTYAPIVKMMRRRGYPVEHISSLRLANGDQVEAVFSTLPVDLLFRHRQRHSIQVSLLAWGHARAVDRHRPAAAA